MMLEITHIFMDVDGTLSDGNILYSNAGGECKAFSVKDGLIIKALPKLGIFVIFITSRASSLVEKRGNELDVKYLLQGVTDKKAALLSCVSQEGLNLENIAYIGDDLNDYAAMKQCGFRSCPADAVREVRDVCDYVSPFHAGHGAVRDVCEFILKQSGKHSEFVCLFREDYVESSILND